MRAPRRWIRWYFPATRFLDRHDDMFLPLTSVKDSRYESRREYVREKVKDGIAMEVREGYTRK